MLNVKALALCLALGISLTTAAAQSPVPRDAAVVDADRLARLDRVLQEHVDQNRIAGAVALVLRDGRPIYERAFGWADKEAGRRMSVDTIFRIASQTKALTSVAILALMEEGRVSLSTPVGAFIPSFEKTVVAVTSEGTTTNTPAKRSITIRDLLTHTAGISYGTESTISELYQSKGLGPAAGYGWYTADKEEGTCETMERLGSLPFVAHPGESYVYGYNTDILGCVVERISGMPLDRFIATRITAPLRMTDTRFFLPPDGRNRLAAVYSSGPGGTIVRAPEGARGQGHYIEGPRKNYAGGAGLLSTARDYARFLEMIRSGGILDGVRILAPRTVALMTTNQIGELRPVQGMGFGLGFETTERYGANGLSSVGTFGWGGAYGSTYRVDPEARLTMVFMMQLIPNRTEIGQRFPTLVYQALTEWPDVPSAPPHRN